MLLPVPNPDVIYRRVTEGAVLLSTKDEVYYGLNAVGANIWERLPPVLTELEQLCASLSELYPEVDPNTIRSDARALLDDFIQHGLVRSQQLKGQHAANAAHGAAQAVQAQRG